jgi:CDP-diacylglycerol--serine O-phosphatidyltransferase
MLSASAIRLSYFSVFGLAGGSKYTGLALDNNNIILVFIFLFESTFNQGVFSFILYISGLGEATPTATVSPNVAQYFNNAR